MAFSARIQVFRFFTFTLALAVFLGGLPLAASADAPAPNTAAWYCHEGAVLMHAGLKNSDKSGVMDWDGNLLSKASENYTQCFQRAQNDDDPLEEIIAIKGYSAARLEYAEQIHLMSIIGFRFLPPAKTRDAFQKLHPFAVHVASQALEAFNQASDLMLRLDPSDDGYTELSNSVDTGKQAAAVVKQTIMEATVDNIPRNKAELDVWFDTNRIPVYRVGGDWGLTREERCPTKGTAITVDSSDVRSQAPGLTGIKVEVSSDGTLRSAHIVQSSGNTDADEAALTNAYHFKYHAATNRCDAIASSTTIWL